MLFPPPPSKIRPAHLERQAFIYVRQSTLFQVREHTASTARQYDLAQRARDLGWPREHLTIIDQDQGHSGASTAGRDGFQSLIAEVGLGHAGAVLSLEVSRLARSSSDWYRLLEICALTDTLVIDEEGVYDPGQYNDRLLLGFKGTMSEAELHWLRNRLLGGKLEKAGPASWHGRTGPFCSTTSTPRILHGSNSSATSSSWTTTARFDRKTARGPCVRGLPYCKDWSCVANAGGACACVTWRTGRSP